MEFVRIATGTTIAAVALLFGKAGLAQTPPAQNTPPAPTPIRKTQGTASPPSARSLQLPMAFEAGSSTQGRQDNFLARGPGYQLALSPSAATFHLTRTASSSAGKQASGKEAGRSTATLKMQLVGADRSAHVAQNTLPTGHANYFLGKDQSRWRTAIPLYSRVQYAQVYRGIDLVYYGNQSLLEYDFLVRPHTDPKQIALKFGGARTVRIAPSGDLVVGMNQGEVRWHKPLTYQMVAGKKRTIASSFVLKKGGKVGFSLARYDTSRPLTIDPKLVYSQRIGTGGVYINTLTVDSAGNTYIAGELSDTGFPTTSGAFQTTPHGAFVAKLNPTGTAFVYATYLGGSGLPGIGSDSAAAIAIDSQGNAYVTGTTASLDFPVTPGAFQTANLESTATVDLGHNANSFVTKLNATGSALIYSTYLGGHTAPGAADTATGIVADSQGIAYVTGTASSADFPTTPGAYQTKSHSLQNETTGFITKFNAAGTGLVYSTLLGGSNGAYSASIALGSAGNVYVTGATNSADFPVTSGAFQTTNHKPASPDATYGSTAFVTQLNATGSRLVYSTYLGGSGKYGEAGGGIAVDAAGSAYVVGTTSSNDFPTTSDSFEPNAPVAEFSVGGAFVTKLNPSGSALLYSTYMGDGDGSAIAIDSAGNACIVGDFFGIGLPAKVGGLPIPQSSFDLYGFLAKLNPAGTALLYATPLPGIESAAGVALDPMGNATVCGFNVVERLSLHAIFPDFNNDGTTDLLLRNRTTGVVGTWLMNGSKVLGGVTFSQPPPATYAAVGVGDFLGNGATALVFQDSVDNRVHLWVNGGATITGADVVDQTPASGWQLVGVADFNQDGRSDLLFQNPTTGRLVIWYMDGAHYTGGVLLSQSPGTDWKVVGTGDFKGEGFTDIVFQNQTTGQITLWYLHRTAYTGETVLSNVPPSGWKVVGAGDYKGDGNTDLLLQNPTTLQLQIWYLNGGVYRGSSLLSQTPPADWKIVGPTK